MPAKGGSRHEAERQPLANVTVQAQNQATPPGPPTLRKSPSSPLIPFHHESLQGNANLRVVNVENKRVSEITNDSQRDSKRGSKASDTSTTFSGRGKERKSYIGPWQLGVTLGSGATGRVRKARHGQTGQIAAVKIMSKRNAKEQRSLSVLQMDQRLAAKPLLSDRKALPFGIEREVVIMKLIEHPNIIRLYDLWENHGEL